MAENVGEGRPQLTALTAEMIAEAEQPTFTHPVLTVFEKNKQKTHNFK